MLFNSYVFILFFLPISLMLYFGLNRLGKEAGAKWALISMSLFFYAYFHISYLFLIVGSILFNFLFSKIIYRQGRGLKGKIILAIGVVVNLNVIFYYKYFNFFLENANAWFQTDFQFKTILMPLGISFFTFQQISYLVDSYQGETEDYRLVDYILFITFFPQLVAGPIVLHNEMMPQFRDKSRKGLNQDYLAAEFGFLRLDYLKR